MKKIALKFGIITGLLIVSVMIISMSMMSQEETMDIGMVMGYGVMLIAFGISIFIGVKSYRDKELGGKITFWKALLVGAAISAVACGFYTAGWLSYVNIADINFYEDYAAFEEAKIQLMEISEAEKEAAIARYRESWELYTNPVMKVLITFTEPMPAAILISLIAAAVVGKNKSQPESV